MDNGDLFGAMFVAALLFLLLSFAWGLTAPIREMPFSPALHHDVQKAMGYR